MQSSLSASWATRTSRLSLFSYSWTMALMPSATLGWASATWSAVTVSLEAAVM
jgi:hypothetical protein